MSTVGFVLSIGLMTASMGTDDPTVKKSYIDAAGQSGEAAYIDSGLNKDVDELFRGFERKYINKEYEKYGTITGILLKTMYEKQLVINFQF